MFVFFRVLLSKKYITFCVVVCTKRPSKKSVLQVWSLKILILFASLACLLDNSAFKHLTPKPPNMAATKVLPLWHTTYFTIFFWPHCRDTPKSPVGERKRNMKLIASLLLAPTRLDLTLFGFVRFPSQVGIVENQFSVVCLPIDPLPIDLFALARNCTCTSICKCKSPPPTQKDRMCCHLLHLYEKTPTWITKLKKCRVWVCLYDVLITYLKRSMPLRTIKELGQRSISWKYRHSLQCGCGQYFYFLLQKRIESAKVKCKLHPEQIKLRYAVSRTLALFKPLQRHHANTDPSPAVKPWTSKRWALRLQPLFSSLLCVLGFVLIPKY